MSTGLYVAYMIVSIIVSMITIAYIYTAKCRKRMSSQALWHEHAATVLLGASMLNSTLPSRMEAWFERYARLPPQNGVVADLVVRIASGDRDDAQNAARALSDLVYRYSCFDMLTVHIEAFDELLRYTQLYSDAGGAPGGVPGSAPCNSVNVEELYAAAGDVASKFAHLNWTPLSYLVEKIC